MGMVKSLFPTPEINLMPSDDLENRPAGKFLKWALNWGKKIVVGTELIVILAFLSRFWLDTTVADLNDKILQKKGIVFASSEFEESFRSVANRVEKLTVVEKSLSSLTVYDEAKKLIPESISLNQITVENKTVSFTGSSDEMTLSKLVASFKDSADFTDISAERIAKKGSTVFVDFAFRATYVGQK